MLRFTKHLVFRPEQGLSQKFMFVAYGSAEHALEAAKRFASLFDKYQLELSQMKNKTQRSEYLARRNLKVKRIIADSRLDLRAQLIAGDSPLCENEMKELPLAKEQHSGKPPISAESLSEGVFQYNDSLRWCSIRIRSRLWGCLLPKAMPTPTLKPWWRWEKQQAFWGHETLEGQHSNHSWTFGSI